MSLADGAHFNAVQNMWLSQRTGFTQKLTTGFYFVTSALTLCNELNLFGFWPFTESPDGRQVRYHYYNNVVLETKIHDISMEWKYIVALHHAGLANVHAGNCTAT